MPNSFIKTNVTRQHQRDGDGDDDAGSPAQRQKAHQQHDGDGFHQRLDELVDRLLHHVRLIGDQAHVDADRQLGRYLFGALANVLAERQRIAARGHGDGEPDGRLAVVAEHGLRRIDVAASHLGDIAQAEEAAVRLEVDRFQAFFRGEPARHADGNPLGTCLDRAAR
jgi:hypothetical protein